MAKSEVKNESPSFFEKFLTLPMGVIMAIPRSLLHPTQPDDGNRSRSSGPIEGYVHNGQIQIQNGNHRFWNTKNRGERDRCMPVKKVDDPHKT
jgi:hypothetical protein